MPAASSWRRWHEDKFYRNLKEIHLESNRAGRLPNGRNTWVAGNHLAYTGLQEVLIRMRAAGVDQGVWHLMTGCRT